MHLRRILMEIVERFKKYGKLKREKQREKFLISVWFFLKKKLVFGWKREGKKVVRPGCFLLGLTKMLSSQVQKFCQDICDLMLGTYVNLELVNPLTKCTLLVIWQIQNVFNASRNKVSSISVKAMPSLSKKQLKKCQILKLDSQHLSRIKKLLKPETRQLARQIPYLLRFMKFSFSKLISLKSVSMCLGFLFSQS